MSNEFGDRIFQLWEYRVSHGSLLIRSPKGPSVPTNIDIICMGVEYVAIPRFLRSVQIDEPSVDELRDLAMVLGKQIVPSSVMILVQSGNRFPIVGASFKIEVNDDDIFDSPFNGKPSPM